MEEQKSEKPKKNYPKFIRDLRAKMLEREWFWGMAILKHSGTVIGAFGYEPATSVTV